MMTVELMWSKELEEHGVGRRRLRKQGTHKSTFSKTNRTIRVDSSAFATLPSVNSLLPAFLLNLSQIDFR